MRVFIAHSSANKDFVDELAANLTRNRVEVWYDKWEMKVGDSLRQKLSEGISGSKFMVVVLSKESLESKWVKEEFNSGLAIAMENKNRFVLPLFLSGDDSMLPVFLKDKIYANFRNDYSVGFRSLLESITGGLYKDANFITRKVSSNWKEVLNELPRDVIERFKSFANCTLDQFGVGIWDLVIDISGSYEAEVEFDRYYEDTCPDQSLELYGLVKTSVHSYRTWGRPKKFFYAGKLTRLGYKIAQELGCKGIAMTKLELLPDN